MITRIENVLNNMDLMEDVYPRHREVASSFKEFYLKRGSLTPAQISFFETFEDRYTDAAVAEAGEWERNYSHTERDIALKIAQYYAQNPPYFANAVKDVLDAPDTHVLQKRQFTKMCQNKYALRILNEYDSTPKFQKAEFVKIRATARLPLAGSHRLSIKSNMIAAVLQVDAAPITRAAKGSRVYKILPVGLTAPVLIHESDLKKARLK